MSTAWRRWASNDPRALIEYVQRQRQGESTRGTPADLLGTSMPAPGVGPPMTRARFLYEAFAARGIQYADEPTTSDPGRQTVRPPDQVLSRPRHGTCLDLAVVFAGACLDAGLHPVVIVLAGARPGDPGHALVAVWLDGNWSNRAHRDYRSDEHDPDWTTLPPDFIDQLVDDEDSPGAFLAIDVTGVASRTDAGDPRRQEQQSWARSVAYGAELLRESGEDRWKVTIDVGLGYEHVEPHPLPYRPGTDVLAPPYLPVPQDNSDSGPLKLLWARHDAIHFHPRDELDFLRDWFQAPDPLGPRTRIALLHGVGGAGKTRLAAELAHQLAGTNWYAGFLVRDPDPRDRAWLSEVASPLLVVVDYVEDRKSADVINVLRTLHEREAPTCLLLTARTVSGWWEEEIAVALREDGHPYVLHDSELAARHPRQTGVYRAALRSFGGSQTAAMGHRPPPDPYSGRWTTLDLVMLAWLAVQSGNTGGVPESEEKLYEKILEHELGYWVRTYASQIGKPSKRTKGILREAGACLSLLAPQEERLDHSLKAIRELADEGKRRDEIAALFADLLPSAPEDGTLAVRPDPLGSHLASSVFGTDRALLRDCLKAADEDEQLNACVSVSRFSRADDGSTATDIANAALNTVPDLWRPALSVAATQGGVFVQALEQLAAAEGTPLPLAELAATVPTGHSTLRRLALIATERSKPDDAVDASEEAQAAQAVWLNNLSVRQSETGDRDAALTSITEATALYRTLAQANPGTFHPNLATSLNNLSNHQSNTGDRNAALTSITEAVHIRRTLAQANPAAFLPDLATSLNNLSNHQSDTGDRNAALTSITEATALYRTLAQANPAAFLPDLAMSLNNLSVQQSDTGDRNAALTSITEATALYRTLAQANPAVFHPDLATSLNNLSVRQSETGDRNAALTSITEAVHIRRTLAQANPAAFLPDLATSLNNLSNRQSETGDRNAALTSITEAVHIRRTLAQANPAAFLPNLAGSLNNLSNQQSETGDRNAALASITEATALYRTLAQANPAVFLPNLAGSLNNLSNQQSDTGDRNAALTSITEATALYRTLAQANPAAFLPNLAMSLNNLSNHQSNTGDRNAALTSITEATALYRTLAQANPGTFLPNLATSLNNLSNHQHEQPHVGEALRVSDLAISELPSGPQAELLVSRAQWRHSHDDQAGAAADLFSAAQCADETTDPAWAGRSRRAVRSLVKTLGQDVLWGHSPDQDPPDLPAWVRDELSSETTDQLNEWLSASSWTEQSAFIRQNYLLLAAPEGRDALALARVLFPEATGLSDLADVLDAAAERGLDQVLEELRDFHTRADLVSEWLATQTWPDDLEFLGRHTQLTDDPLVRELLASRSHDPASRQHLAILQLTDRLAAPDVYDAVTDPSTANDTAMTFIGAGEPEALYPLFLAAPALLRMPFVTPYLFAVHTLFDATTTGSPPSASDSGTLSPIELITEAATQASEVQRGAGAARLRRLAEHRPEHAAALLQLATLLTSAAPAPGSDGG